MLTRLSQYQAQEELPFLVVHSAELVAALEQRSFLVHALSPQVMSWDEQTLIIRIDASARYWQVQAKRCGVEYVELLERQLAVLTPYRAVLCQHPWQGLTLLPLLDPLIDHVVPYPGAFAQNLVREMSWAQWRQPFAQLFEHLKALNLLKDGSTTRMHQFERFLQRMRLRGPHALAGVDFASLQKRFGATLGQAWQWTQVEQPQLDILMGFPWRAEAPTEVLEVERHLEYPLNDWELIAQMLREDLQRLCRLPQFHAKWRICRWDWSVVLYNMEQIELPILFRHPHNLSEDEPEHRVSLQQAEYGFAHLMRRLQEREDHLDLPEQIPFIAWKVKLSEWMALPRHSLNLLQVLSDGPGDEERVLELENLLPVPLERQVLAPGFLPFSATQESQTKNPDPRLWRSAALLRPLFIHPQPRELPQSPGRALFLERSVKPWWLGEQSVDYGCDFYKVQKKQQWIWASRETGRWIEYGQFD